MAFGVQAAPDAVVAEERLTELMEIAEDAGAGRPVTKYLPCAPAFRDTALAIKELLEHRRMR